MSAEQYRHAESGWSTFFDRIAEHWPARDVAAARMHRQPACAVEHRAQPRLAAADERILSYFTPEAPLDAPRG